MYEMWSILDAAAGNAFKNEASKEPGELLKLPTLLHTRIK
jgi:hypothetical protein